MGVKQITNMDLREAIEITDVLYMTRIQKDYSLYNNICIIICLHPTALKPLLHNCVNPTMYLESLRHLPNLFRFL